MKEKDKEKEKSALSKKKEEQETTEGMPVRYIKQPYPISAMQADLSRQQIRILVGMMQSIQDGVQEMFSNPQRNKDGQLLLFPELEDDHVNIDFKFSDVVDRPDSYKNVEKVADKFMHMVFRYEDKEAGEVTLKHFVEEVSYPSRGSKRDRIRFSFTKRQAQAVFNFTMYSRYLQSVAFNAGNKYTARLYMLFTTYRGYEKNNSGVFHWYVGYAELRRMLGCDEQDEKGTWKQVSQVQYKHFKSNVLKTAETELKGLAEAGKSDCWFEYVELPENWKGQPERFDFLIHLTEIGALESKSDNPHDELCALLVEKFDYDKEKGSELMKDVTDIEGMKQKIAEIEESIKKRGAKIRNIQKYVEKCVKEWISSSQPSAPSPQPSDLLTIKSSWLRIVGMKNYNMYLSDVKLSEQDGKVIATVPHPSIKEWMENYGLEKLSVDEVKN